MGLASRWQQGHRWLQWRGLYDLALCPRRKFVPWLRNTPGGHRLWAGTQLVFFSSGMCIPGLEDDRSIRTGGIRVRMGSHSPGAATLRHHNFFLLLVFGRGFSPLSRFFKWVLDCTALTHNERAGMQIYGRRRRVVCAGALSTFLM